MQWILDACTLIYLVKSSLLGNFIQNTDHPVVIDTSVFNEVVLEGKTRNYPDAFEAEDLLNSYQIPIIPVDISLEISKLINPGETSCFILSKKEGICLTSDDRAFKKFEKYQIDVLKIDFYFYKQFLQKKISEAEFFQILKKLEAVNGTTPKAIAFFYQEIAKKRMEII